MKFPIQQTGFSLLEALILMAISAVLVSAHQQLLAHATELYQRAHAKRLAVAAHRYLTRPLRQSLYCQASSDCDWPWPLPASYLPPTDDVAPSCWRVAVAARAATTEFAGT